MSSLDLHEADAAADAAAAPTCSPEMSAALDEVLEHEKRRFRAAAAEEAGLSPEEQAAMPAEIAEAYRAAVASTEARLDKARAIAEEQLAALTASLGDMESDPAYQTILKKHLAAGAPATGRVSPDGPGGLEGFDPAALDDALTKALAALTNAGLDWGNAPVDHACWRCASPKEYEYACCRALASGADLLGEALIGGRPVAVFALATPLRAAGQAVPLLEIPAPKPGRPYAAGWEHAEIALGDGLEAFAAGLRDDARGLDVDWRAWDKPVNRDVSVAAPGSSFRVKFHAAPLDEVIRKERADGSFTEVAEDYWDAALDKASAAEATALASLEDALRTTRKPRPPGESPLAAALAGAFTSPEAAAAPDVARYEDAARRLLAPASRDVFAARLAAEADGLAADEAWLEDARAKGEAQLAAAYADRAAMERDRAARRE